MIPDPSGILKTGSEVAKGPRHVFRADPVKFVICETVVIREGRNLPWDHRVALHRQVDGYLHQEAIVAKGRRRSPGVPWQVRMALLAVVVAIIAFTAAKLMSVI